jgi:hypothetical protein
MSHSSAASGVSKICIRGTIIVRLICIRATALVVTMAVRHDTG